MPLLRDARRTAATLALAIGMFAAPSQPAGAAEKSIWGPVDPVPGASRPFDLYRRLGVDTFQTHLTFAGTAPSRPAHPTDPTDPAYRWPQSLDRVVAEGRRTKIAIAIQVSRSPRWANGNRPAIWRPGPRAFADFLTAASRRYPSVRRWMIWGEPNRVAAYRPNRRGSTIGPRSYAILLDASYAALKRVSSRNIVIGGMTYTGGGGGETTPAPWLRAMKLPNGRPPRLDWYGHNPFSTRYPDLRDRAFKGGYRDIGDLDLFSREVARTYRRIGRRPKLWLSEYVIQSDHGSEVFNVFVSRRGQAQWLSAAFRIANHLPSVAGLGWLALEDEQESNLSANFGLVTATGQRKPSFSAFRSAPSRAFRPRVIAARRARAASGLKVTVTPRLAGRVRATLTSSDGRIVIRASAQAAKARPSGLRLRSRRLRRGRYTLWVDAPRAERVRQSVLLH